MKQVSTPSEMRFNAEFEKRLERLSKALDNYLQRGYNGDVLPALYACCTLLWAKSPYITKLKKVGR